ncbi:lytic murein transglycosylase [Fodinicurvata sp. EGI_FJ10296]|uniref:lytic murein transglycosylase n=1 Tax=Fodinicurvata sp. EGI_FJ10296 TaxID=3231908 RepID=UPI0034562536
MQTAPNPAFDTWLDNFRPRARAEGISETTLNAAFDQAGFLPDVVQRDRNQAEFTLTLEGYLGSAASDSRVENGRAMLARYRPVLDSIEARYGVPPHVVVAVWGMESNYGSNLGTVPVISALATLAYDGRRGAFFEQQLIAALRILQNGDTTPDRMTGSWAGAMGHTQFIPTTYEAYAVDFTGDGRRDIWSAADPTDALASAAAYLSRSGWTSGEPWGLEVQLPAGFNHNLTGRDTTRSAGQWASMGVRDMNGNPPPGYGSASILTLAGSNGPAFMVFDNFGAFLRYNNSEFYAVGVGHLSDRLNGGPPIQAAFPPDEYGMMRGDRRDLQRLLTEAGFDTQGVDGAIGPNSEAAIRAYQRSQGLPVTGEPSLELLDRLR